MHQLNNVQAACNLIFNANFILYLNKSTQHSTIGDAIDYFLDRAQFVHATHLSSAVQTFNHTNWKEIDSEDMLYELTALNEFPELYTAYQITANCNSSKKKGDEQRLNKLREYTTKAIENDYNQLVSKRNEVVDSLMGSGDWWKDNDHHGGKKKKKKLSRSIGPEKSAPQEDNEEISIKFVDEQSQEQQDGEVSIKITKSTQLKIPFNQYAEGRRSSLRSFRFVYGGSTLFLSSVGKQTPIDLGMEDGDVITVINLEASKEAEKPFVAKVASKQKKKSSSKKRTKGKQKKKRASQPLVIQQTEVELKVKHSKLLGRVHEQAESQFKLIRQHLNNLVLERSKPKSKKKKNNKAPLQPISQVVNTTPSSIGLGGKAGKTHYTIQVGEVSNLYKTSKRRRSRSPPTNQLKIDLHGLTRQESIKSLDDSLPIWQERAMSGSYPFVVPVEIVCGGGSQVLSEVVEQWIRNNDQVANAPKTRCC